MIKRLFIRMFGVNAYVDGVQSLTGLYHSLFRAGDMREAGIRLIPRMIPRGGVVFDIGAHIGKFSVLAAGAAGKNGRVYAFEPVRWPRNVMSRMVSLRRLRQVQVVPCGLSDQAGEATIRIPLKRGGLPLYMLSHLSAGGTAEEGVMLERIALQTIDGFCSSAGIDRLDFIKCDVEGAEWKVFSAGSLALARFRPTIFCEVAQDMSRRSSAHSDSLFSLLGQLGYGSYQADAAGDTLVATGGYREAGDYFFIHTGRTGEFSGIVQ